MLAEPPKRRGRPPAIHREADYARKIEKLGMDLSLAPPKPILGAEFQAGVTPGNEQFRVTMNDEPLPLAIAASATGGWAICRLPAVVIRETTGYELAAHTVTLRGVVKIVPIRHNESN